MPLTLQDLVVTKGHTYLNKRAAKQKLHICLTMYGLCYRRVLKC